MPRGTADASSSCPHCGACGLVQPAAPGAKRRLILLQTHCCNRVLLALPVLRMRKGRPSEFNVRVYRLDQHALERLAARKDLSDATDGDLVSCLHPRHAPT